MESKKLTRRGRSVAASAKVHGIAPCTLREAIRKGKLAHSRPGSRTVYVTDADVAAWLRRQTVPPTPTAEANAQALFEKMNP